MVHLHYRVAKLLLINSHSSHRIIGRYEEFLFCWPLPQKKPLKYFFAEKKHVSLERSVVSLKETSRAQRPSILRLKSMENGGGVIFRLVVYYFRSG